MIMIADKTGRFPQRPHYRLEEFEAECEEILTNYFMRRYGQLVVPVPTPALVALLEDEAATVNLFRDLTAEGDEIHGLTEFYPGARPDVSIARELSYQHWREHRLRTTLTHEFCHVHWHAWLFDRYRLSCTRHKCARGMLLPGEDGFDWMEWQAGYVSGALLMPKSSLELHIGAFRAEWQAAMPLNREAVEGRLLIARTTELFNVSALAAGVRLGQLGYLQ